MRNHTVLLLALAFPACSVVSPPPVMMRHEAVVPAVPGAMSAGVAGGSGGGIFIKDAAGGFALFERQMTEKFKLGFSGGAGARIEKGDEGHNDPKMLYFGRLHGHQRPVDWMGVDFGVGGGYADSGLTYLTLDTGVTFGHSFWNRLRPYGGPVFALSLPITQGKGLGENHDLPRSTLYCGLTGGASVRIVGSLEFSAEVTGMYGVSPGVSDVTLFGATGMLRYSF